MIRPALMLLAALLLAAAAPARPVPPGELAPLPTRAPVRGVGPGVLARRAYTRMMRVSVYVPMKGAPPINGNGRTASGLMPRTGAAACGPSWPFGTVFVLPEDVEVLGLPEVVVCMDRGGAVGDNHLDIAYVPAARGVRWGLMIAREWGVRTVEVLVVEVP